MEHQVTNLTSLPNNIKQQILQHLNTQDHKNCRLVCKEWFQLINSTSKLLPFKLSNNSLQLSTKASSKSIHNLMVENLTETLPIASRTRSQVPVSDKLSLHSRISKENVLKLLRYQTRSVESLELGDMCLANVDSFHMKNICPLDHLRKFSFHFWYELHKQTFIDFIDHVAALTTFLTHAKIPNLISLKAGIDFPKQIENIHGRPKLQFMDDASKKFNLAFGNFLKSYGEQLTKFHLYLNGTNVESILSNLGSLVNVKRLKFRLHEADSTTTQLSHFVTAFKSFGQLISLNVSLFPKELQQAIPSSLIIFNNLSTLKYLELQHWISSVSWLTSYSCIHSAQINLIKYLELRLKISDKEFFQQSNTYLNQFKCLVRAKLYVHHHHTQAAPQVIDWREEFMDWIIKMMPNLHYLELIITNTIMTKAVAVPVLVHGLSKLREIDLSDRWKKLHQLFLLITEIGDWCKNTQGVDGAWEDDYSFYRITINDRKQLGEIGAV